MIKSTQTTAAGPDLTADVMFVDPYPVLVELRAREPVHWSDRHQSWMLTRYDDVRDALKDTRLSTELTDDLLGLVPQTHPLHRYIQRWMLFKDGADHKRLRGLVARAFTPGVISRLHDSVADIVDELASGLAARGGGNFMEDFAGPLPAIVIGDLLGLPRADASRIGAWSNAMSAMLHRELGRERFDASAEAMRAFAEYLHWQLARLRESPDDGLLSRLIAARDADDLLSEDELIAAAMLFLFGGHETTTSLLGNAVVALTREADGLNTLTRDTNIETAVEEFIRFDGPGRFPVRHVGQGFEKGDARFEPGQRVFLSLCGANRDPLAFEQPDRLDLSRDPNCHLGFGIGAHFCLGANLARLETRLALATLVRRCPTLRFNADEVVWRRLMLQRMASSVPYAV